MLKAWLAALFLCLSCNCLMAEITITTEMIAEQCHSRALSYWKYGAYQMAYDEMLIAVSMAPDNKWYAGELGRLKDLVLIEVSEETQRKVEYEKLKSEVRRLIKNGNN